MPKSFAITDDTELETAVRDKTSYAATSDELPGTSNTGQMHGIIEDAKRYLYMRTGSDAWYSDLSYGHALVTLTALKAKEAVENISIASYGIGDEQVRFTDADPESSQQIVSWSDELNEALSNSNIDLEQNEPSFSNTTSYIG